MAIHLKTRAMQLAFLLSAAALAQTTPPQSTPAAPCPAANQPANQNSQPCPPPAKKPSAAEQFPFPGESAKPAPPPDSPKPATTPSDAATQHPFPAQPPPKLPPDESSSSSSSSSNGDDPDPTAADTPTVDKDGNPTPGFSVHRKLPKVKKVQSDDERVDEDLAVAKFYLRDENYQGAYLRAKDAVNVQPDYSDAHFALAEIAQKMKKKDEAIAEYHLYLKLDPDGEKAKAAKKALSELQ
jgi:tetratricopeptide (TPR) repeat protein